MSDWQVGVAVSAFAVPPGTVLGGYADRVGPSTGTLDTLEITALVLQAGDTVMHLIGADVVAVDTALRDDIVAASGIPASSILLSASHTHSGPLGIPRRLHPASSETVDAALRDRFVQTAAETLARARSVTWPGDLGQGTVHVNDAWSNRNDATAPTDNRVKILTVRDRDNHLRALVLLVPCHPTVLGAWNHEVSADLHGSIRRALRQHPGVDVPVVTLTGAAGDISTRFARRESSIVESDQLGALVARSVVAGLKATTPVSPDLRRTSTTVTLPVRRLTAPAVELAYREALAQWETTMNDPSVGESGHRVAFTRLQGADIQRRMVGMRPATVTLDGWRLGTSLGIVAIPGEPFSSLGLAIEATAETRQTWVVGYANGYVGYLADADAHQSRSYEALASPWSEKAGEAVVAGALRMLASIGDPP